MTLKNIVHAEKKWGESRRDVSRDLVGLGARLEQHSRLTYPGDIRVSKWLRSRIITYAVYAILTSADEFDVTPRTIAEFSNISCSRFTE